MKEKERERAPSPEVPLRQPTKPLGESLECPQHNLTESHCRISVTSLEKLQEVASRSYEAPSSSRAQPSLQPSFDQSKLPPATPSRPTCSLHSRQQIPAKSCHRESLTAPKKVTQKRPTGAMREQHATSFLDSVRPITTTVGHAIASNLPFS